MKRKYNQGIDNPMYGRKPSLETIMKIRQTKLAEKNPRWVGDKITKNPLHAWVKRRLVKPELCQKCNKKSALDLANISGLYKRVLDDWIWLCRSCHMHEDGRIRNLKHNETTL